jgi:tellurite resistance protein
MRRQYQCSVTNLATAAEAPYVRDQVGTGDPIELRADPVAPGAISAFHQGRRIGRLSDGDRWIGPHLVKCADNKIEVDDLIVNDEGELDSIDLSIELALPDEEQAPQSVISEIGEELRLLMTVVMADGVYHVQERELLQRFADIRAREVGVVPAEGEVARAVRWARRRVPSPFETAQIIGRLAIDRPSAFDAILEVADLAAEMDGKVVDEERAKVTMLRDLIEIGRQYVPGN